MSKDKKSKVNNVHLKLVERSGDGFHQFSEHPRSVNTINVRGRLAEDSAIPRSVSSVPIRSSATKSESLKHGQSVQVKQIDAKKRSK